MNKFLNVLIGALVALVAFSACGGVPFVSQNTPTETATRRTIRPTFTPKPRVTATQETAPTLEPDPTGEPEPTKEPTQEPEPVTNTPRPTRRPQQTQPTKPPQPTAPPQPQFLIKIGTNYLCEQQGVYKVIVNAKSGRTLMAGATFAFFDGSGRLLQDGAGKDLIAVTTGDFNISIGSNCRVESDRTSPNTSNGELDVGDAVRAGNNPIIMRFVKSAADLTPISENVTINFANGGQYWIYTNTQ